MEIAQEYLSSLRRHLKFITNHILYHVNMVYIVFVASVWIILQWQEHMDTHDFTKLYNKPGWQKWIF